MTVGMALNGIPILPYNADYFDQKNRGFSKDPFSSWKKRAMFSSPGLGIDLY